MTSYKAPTPIGEHPRRRRRGSRNACLTGKAGVTKLLLLFLLTFSCHAMADWVQYHAGANGDAFFFDAARVDKNGDLVTVWTRIRYKTSVMAASSYQSLIRIDCDAYSQTTLQSTFYTDRNWSTPAMATDTSEKPKVSIVADSPAKRLADIVCE